MKKFFVFALFTIFLFQNCSQSIKISHSGFKSLVPLGGNLHFKFNQDIVDDSKVNIWDTAQYIIFEPQIQGKFKWKNKRELIFSPYSFLRPVTNYKAHINTELINTSDEDVVNFNTPYFELEQIKVYHAKIPYIKQGKVLRYDLNFSYKIRPTELKKFLNVKVNGKPTNYELLTDEFSNSISLYVHNNSKNFNPKETEVIINKGLQISKGIFSKSTIVKKLNIPDADDFKIDQIIAQHDGFTGIIKIMANQDISDKNIRNFIQIIPKLNYTLSLQGSEISIKSDDFDASQTYLLTISKGLSGTLGASLSSDFTQEVNFDKLKPEIKILNQKGIYLSSAGFKNIAVRIVSVPKIQVSISKVYKNNIISYLGNSNYNSEYYYADYYSYSDKAVGDLGDKVWEKSISTANLPKQNNYRVFNLNFADKIPDKDGIYVIEIRSENDYWVKARRMISLSDIGIIAKEGKNFISIFTNSIKTAKPLENVKFEIIGKNNQSLGFVTSDKNGYAQFNLTKYPAQGFSPKLITAKLGNDFNVLPYNKTAVGTSRFDISGKSDNLAGYDAFIYGERDIYRPGETMHISAIVRNENWKFPGKIPVKLKIYAPNGKVFINIKKVLNEKGAFETQISLPTSAPTGKYTVELYSSTNVFLNSIQLIVEEFVPDRIKVSVETSKNSISLNEVLNINLKVHNLFGPPAANRKYEIQQNIKRKYFYAKNYSAYNFEIKGAKSYFSSQTRSGKTNAQGLASESYKLPTSYSNMGLLQTDYFITVFDETGRPVNRKNTVNVYTQKTFYGIEIPDYYNTTGHQMNIPLIAVNTKGEVLNGIQARVKLIKHEYRTVLAKSGSYYRYKSEHEELILQNKMVSLNGTSTVFNFVPKKSGRYELRISAMNSKTYVSSDFYAYGWGSTSNSSFQVNTEGNIDIELDKENYNVGDKAKVIMKTPFSGKVLVTVERNNVSKYFYLNTDKRAASFDLDIRPDYVPNVYISATLIKPHGQSDIPLTVAHGFKAVPVNNAGNKINVSISSVKKSNSRTKQKITIKSAPNAAVTVSVVDEGVLQVSGYASPDPYKFFYRKRALDVKSYDIYPYLFPEIAIRTGLEGGGDDEMENRINPMTNKRFKLVSFWSGILYTNKSGIVNFDIDIPQFSGDLRIMAVSYKEHSFGAATSHMKVADPVVISTALPRFLSPKDTVQMGITLSNTTDKQMRISLNVDAGGALKLISNNEPAIYLSAHSEKQLYYNLASGAVIGQAKVSVQASVNGKKYLNQTDISIRPASPLQKISGSGFVLADQTKSISIGLNKFMKKSLKANMIVSKSPLVRFSNDLSYLLGYPYGCVEQTVSKAFPQLYFADLAKNVSETNKFNATYNINEAIKKLQLMQLYNGGMSFWPGGGNETWWGSVYAAHFLYEAQKANYQVDQSMLNKLYKYLKVKLNKKKTFKYWYNGNKNRMIAPKEVAYTLYVMALAGKPKISMMNYYKSRPNQLSLDAKYLLAAAYALSGDMKRYKEILPAQFSGEVSKQVFGGSFYSPIRDEAISLNALLEVNPDNPQIGLMAKHLSESMNNRRYLSTQERVFAFLAMGKIAQNAKKTKITATIKNGNNIVSKFKDKDIKLTTNDLSSGNLSISTNGIGKLYYFWDAQGISSDGSYLQEDKFMRVRKTFYNRYGNVIQGNTFKQNDLIVVKISITGSYSTTIKNVVISDLLPAGFEIENPRISATPGMNWIKNKSYPVYQDIRDDRINIFVTVNNRTKNYYYVVRAVTPGIFHMGPVGADAMYNGAYHSYHGAGIIRIVR